jgi:cell division protein FtsW
MTREQADARMAERRRRMERREMQEMREQESRELAKGPIDLPFFLLVLLLTAIGLVMLFSASFPSAYYKIGKPTYYLTRQGVFAVMGFAVMILVSKINYQRFRGAAKPLLALSVMLLMLVLVPHVGITRNNATRWLGVGELLTFQPSEIAKMAVVLYFADTISRKKDKMQTFRYGILPYAFILGIIAVLMLMEPHLSGTVLILATGAVMMLVGGIEWKWVIGVLGMAGAGVLVLLTGW